MGLLRSNSNKSTGQLGVSPQTRLPVDDGVTQNTQTVTADTATLYYYTAAGVETADAGQAAGTVVVANLTNKNICNSLGFAVGEYGDTSFAWVTGTIFTRLVPYRGLLAEEAQGAGETNLASAKARAVAVTTDFRNGDYCIDHEHGVIYGKKATTGTSDTCNYKVLGAGGGGTLSSNVNVAKLGGVTIPLDDAAFTPGTTTVMPIGFTADETTPDSVNEGDIGAARMTLDRRVLTANLTTDDAAPETGTRVSMVGGIFDDTTTDTVDEGDAGYTRISGDRKLMTTGSYVDDTAFTPAGANSYVNVMAAQADETAPDSVDEGDAGALRMTLDRRLITASNILDDAAFGIGTGYVSPMGALVDDTATDSVDEGDVGLPRMSATRILYTQGAVAAAATDSGNPLKIGGVYNTTQPTYTNGQRGDAQLDARGNLKVSMESVLDSTNDSITSYAGSSATATGSTVLSLGVSGLTGATATAVKASIGNLYGFHFACPLSSVVSYMQFHNLTTASVTPGVTVPLFYFVIGADSDLNSCFTSPISFSTAITIVSSTLPGGSVAPTIPVYGNIRYK